ncbi:hypothetical protein F383_23791 [Gossypium arboreum]|uniref:Uncharacterized protein n=1 Tax=Gossypium arboreum TaxID=29729 RepID=A0A0B0NTA3_GOSAR|nr:hypothetical protein F383_23791 [Gossypium arboreum]
MLLLLVFVLLKPYLSTAI